MYNSLDTVYKQNRHFENKSALSEERNPNFLWQQHLLIDSTLDCSIHPPVCSLCFHMLMFTHDASLGHHDMKSFF